MIEVANEQQHVAVTEREVRAVVEAVYAAEGVAPVPLSVAVVDDETIRDVNKRHLDHDWATDSISFGYAEPGEELLEGDVAGEVVVSAETAAREAAEHGHGPRFELYLYLAHATLHLLGYDDDTPERREAMNARAAEILGGLPEEVAP